MYTGVTCLDFWYGRAAGVPGPHPIHILSLVKNLTHSYTYSCKTGTYPYTNFTHFTKSYTFWVKMIPHWNTFEVKSIPIHILGSLKSIPHSSRTSVYTFIMKMNPPWLIFLSLSRTLVKGQGHDDVTSENVCNTPFCLLWFYEFMFNLSDI